MISLPDSYDESGEEKRYPVMILLDGNVFFKTATGVVHFMSSQRNRNHLMPETIVVAIENVDRERDFTVTKIQTKRVNTMGGGRNFLDFIQKELIPYVDGNYRTEPHRTLAGHSLGGLLTINAYLDANSLFDAYLAIDPSLWWDEQMMVQKVEAVQPTSLEKKLYIATANQGEANQGKNKKRHDAFYAGLHEKAGRQIPVAIEYFADEDHRSVPLKALYNGLKFLNSANP